MTDLTFFLWQLLLWSLGEPMVCYGRSFTNNRKEVLVSAKNLIARLGDAANGYKLSCVAEHLKFEFGS